MKTKQVRRSAICLMLLLVVNSLPGFVVADLLYEGFDVSPGTLDNQAGATSFGFHPGLGTVWDSGTFGSPNVGPGSIMAPASTSSFYNASPVGNRVVQDYQSTVIGRQTQVTTPQLYGTFLATMGLNGAFITSAMVNFDNFKIIAENPGSNSTTATWKIQTSGGTFDTGVNAQGTTLVAWDLAFDQASWANPDTLHVWLNKNPLSDTPDFSRSTDNLGQNQMGGIHFNNTIFLGLSIVEFDEFRVGGSWQAAGINSAPEPSASVMLILAGLSILQRRRASNKSSTIM
jgi:hypothetical protein